MIQISGRPVMARLVQPGRLMKIIVFVVEAVVSTDAIDQPVLQVHRWRQIVQTVTYPPTFLAFDIRYLVPDLEVTDETKCGAIPEHPARLGA